MASTPQAGTGGLWPRRPRKRRVRALRWQVPLLVAASLYLCAVAYNRWDVPGDVPGAPALPSLPPRRRLAASGNVTVSFCTNDGSVTSEFPDDGFTTTQRRDGALVIHCLVIIYMFVGIGIVCDEFFEASLAAICKNLNLKPDIAGATFMAARWCSWHLAPCRAHGWHRARVGWLVCSVSSAPSTPRCGCGHVHRPGGRRRSSSQPSSASSWPTPTSASAPSWALRCSTSSSSSPCVLSSHPA